MELFLITFITYFLKLIIDLNKYHDKSAIVGANQLKGTLRGFGKFIAWLLDKVDKGHCLRAYNKRVVEIM